MAQMEAIIYSMTSGGDEEIRICINPSRKHRIAKGAGVDIAEVNRMVKQFEQIQKDDEETSWNDGRQRWKKGQIQASLLSI